MDEEQLHRCFLKRFFEQLQKTNWMSNWWLQWLISTKRDSWRRYAVRPFKIRGIIVEFHSDLITIFFCFAYFFLVCFWPKYGLFGFFFAWFLDGVLKRPRAFYQICLDYLKIRAGWHWSKVGLSSKVYGVIYFRPKSNLENE